MGGRLLPGVETFLPGKYVNSPETPLFRKSHLLYGLDLAKEAIHKSKIKTALVMEGYTDVIVAHQFGFNNAVAVLGVALGETHVKILKRFVDRIILVLDGDEAGQKRANEVLELFVAQQVDLQILTLPDDLDPCDFLQQRGADAFAELLATGTVDALDHAFRSATRGLDLDRDIHGASQALERLIGILAKAPRLAARYDQRRSSAGREVPAAVRRLVPRERDRSSPPPDDPPPPRTGHRQDAYATAKWSRRSSRYGKRRPGYWCPATAVHGEPAWRPGETIDAYEREFAELLIVYPDTWSAARAAIARAQLTSPALRRIYETGCRLLDVGVLPDFDRLILEFDDPSLKSLLVDLDEQGRAKGSRMAEPAELLSELLKAFQRREVEKQQPGQLVALREQNLDDDQEIDLLQKIVQQERSRQGISDPMDG